MQERTKRLAGILGVATVIFGLFYLYTQTSSPAATPGSDFELAQLLTSTQVFIARSQELDQMRFDFSVLEDQRFRSLRSFTDPVRDQEAGRSNPFAQPESAVFVETAPSE